MKNVHVFLIGISAMLILLASCKKDDSTTSQKADYSTINKEKANTQSSLKLSTAYNDTLIMYYDTTKVKKNNVYCVKYDKLYHKQDSLFTMHYGMFGDEMYKNGMMMNGYSPSSMMGSKGMMNNNMMDTLKRDTSIVNACFSQMKTLRAKHLVYHNGIYN
jgi:hypothetical protein